MWQLNAGSTPSVGDESERRSRLTLNFSPSLNKLWRSLVLLSVLVVCCWNGWLAMSCEESVDFVAHARRRQLKVTRTNMIHSWLAPSCSKFFFPSFRPSAVLTLKPLVLVSLLVDWGFHVFTHQIIFVLSPYLRGEIHYFTNVLTYRVK